MRHLRDIRDIDIGGLAMLVVLTFIQIFSGVLNRINGFRGYINKIDSNYVGLVFFVWLLRGYNAVPDLNYFLHE